MADYLNSISGFFDKYASPINSLTGLAKQFEALNLRTSSAQSQINSLNMAGDLEYAGGILSAEGYRKSKINVAKATAYNIAQDKINLQREMQSLSRSFQRTIGEQITSTAARGISVSSKSALMLRNETVNVYDTALLQLKLDAENNIRNQLYTSRVKQMELEQQAQVAEYQGKLAKVQAANRAAEVAYQLSVAEKQTYNNVIESVPTLLGQISRANNG